MPRPEVPGRARRRPSCHPAARTDAADRLKTMALVVAHWRRDNPYVEPGVVPRKSVAKGGD